MAKYSKNEAKQWARERFRGVHNVILPTLTNDFKGINEKAVRHDVREDMRQGYFAALLVSECGTTLEEMKRFAEIAVDEAGGKLLLTLQLSFDHINQYIEMAEFAEEVGCDALLLYYPPSFYPKDTVEVYDFTKKICDSTNLGFIAFPGGGRWDFSQFHPSGVPPELIRKVCSLPNVVALKTGWIVNPMTSLYETWKSIKGQVLLGDPDDAYWPLYVDLYEMQWGGTGNFEYLKGCVKELELLRRGEFEKAMQIYWQLQPARHVNTAHMNEHLRFGLHHRWEWKYQAWLVGFNGGPIRMPQMRLNPSSMKELRKALIDSGIEPTIDPDEKFFIGRNPS